MNKSKIKSLSTLIGKSLGIFGLLFVFYTLSQEYTLSSFIKQLMLLLQILPILFLLNALSVLIGIFAWHIILLQYTKNIFPFLISYYYFSKTEIAKYLPGNIFHFLGRQVLASKVHISQIQMAKISLMFSILLLIGTTLTSTIFAFLSQEIPPFILTLMGISSIMSFIIFIYLYPSFSIRKKVSIYIYLALSVTLQGIMMGMIAMYQSENFTANLFFQCISIYTLSWLIGFVTPGASGGLGIREGTFIAISTYLQLNISTDIIIFSVLLVRLINICVDVMLYISTIILEKKMKELEI